jgi:hypothetical protein
MKPVWDGKAFQPRLILPLSLSYDHRVIDGAPGARFTAYLAQLLADMRRVHAVTTISPVKKNGVAAIAADSLTTFGDTRLARSYKGEHDKILEIAGSNWIGLCGSSAHHLVPSGPSAPGAALPWAPCTPPTTAASSPRPRCAKPASMAGIEFDTATGSDRGAHRVHSWKEKPMSHRRSEGARHRRLQGRAGHRSLVKVPATRSRPRIR